MPELSDESYRVGVTTHTEIAIAGIPWPMYKLLALIVGGVTLLRVGGVTASMGTAVLAAAGAATLVWLTGSITARR